MHQWYAARGWHRWMASTQRGMATVYWAPIEIHRPLCASPFDPGIVVTEVPGFGPTHIVPDGWAVQRGADGAEIRERGSTPSLASPLGANLPGKATVLGAG